MRNMGVEHQGGALFHRDVGETNSHIMRVVQEYIEYSGMMDERLIREFIRTNHHTKGIEDLESLILAVIVSRLQQRESVAKISALSEETERLVDRVISAEGQLDIIYSYEGTFDVTPEGTIIGINNPMIELLGYSQEELIGKHMSIMSSGFHTREFWNSFLHTINSGNVWRGDIVSKKKDGSFITLRTLVIPKINKSSVVIGFKIIQNHNFEYHDLKDQMQNLLDAEKKIDPLTGLPNREKCIENCRDDVLRTATILHMHNVRDIRNVYGKTTEDRTLKRIAARLREYAQQNPEYGIQIYRLDGPDFLLLYNDTVTEDFIREQYMRIQHIEFTDNKRNISLSFSLGMAFHETDIHILIKKCFLALERAKDGRQAAIYDSNIDTTHGSETLLTMQTLVSRAFVEDLFEVHGQKIVKNPSGNKFLGWLKKFFSANNTEKHTYEVLVRMRNPDDPSKLIFPGAFIDVIKQTGQGKELTTLIIDKTCVAMRIHPLMQCSINITEDDLRTPGRAESIHKQIIHNRIPSSRITFEILESIETLTPEILENIHLLKEAGFHIAIDDAGSGSSGLLRLTQFEADKVKIDMKLIRGIDKNSKHRAVVASLISLAHTLGMTVTAEGVETSEEWDTVIELGTDYIQGYINDNKPKPF